MKKSLAMVLCLAMICAVLAACGGNAAPTQTPAEVPAVEPTAAPTEAPAETPAESEAPSSEAAPAEPSAEVTEVEFVRPGTPPEAIDELMAAINAKLLADGTGLRLNINFIPSDTFQDKLMMMFTAGEEFDLLAVMEDQKPLTSFIAVDGIAPITGYVQNSPNLLRVIPEWMWESATMNGDIYTIPANWTEIADQACNITIRRDKMEQFGLDDPETREDLLEMCEAFTEKWDGSSKPVVIPMFREPFTWLFRTLDSYPFTVQKDLIYIDQEGNVKNWMETEEFKICAEFFGELYAKGYVPTDILATGWSSWNTMQTGDFIWVDGCQMWGTREYFDGLIPGINMDTIYLNPGAESFRPNSFRNDTAVSSTSTHPELAVKFMDWMYSAQENYDLLVYGVEGLTYTDEGDGLYTKLVPEFEFNADWMIGNLEYIRYEVGTYEKFIEIMGVEKPDATNSVVLNFTFDPTSVSTEFANCSAEVTASIYPIKLGIVPYAEGYEDALDKMKAAGIDAVVAEYQRQVDEYLAAQ